MPRGTGFRGPLFFSAPHLPFDSIPLSIAQALTADRSGVAVGGNALYTGPRTAGTSGGWTLTETSAGAGNGNNVAQNHLGQLVLTTDNGDNDLENMQYTGRLFRYSTTRKLACFARIALGDANDGEALFGLAVADTSLTASAPADGIYFNKAETATDWTINVISSAASSTTATAGLTLSDDGFVVLGFTIVGGAIRWWAKADSNDQLNDDNPFWLGAGTSIVNTNAPATTTDLLLSLGIQTGATDVDYMTVDWAFCVEWDS